MSIANQIVRRIEKFFETPNQKPSVPPIGTDHINDNWSNDLIYKGELVINLSDGTIYTQDGREIIDLNRYDAILDGLLVKKPPVTTTGIALDLTIESGSAIINGKYYEHISNDPNSDIQLLPNFSTTLSRLDIIYAESDYPNTDINGNYKLKFNYDTTLVGSNLGQASNNIVDKLLNNFNTIYTDKIILGIVWVPPNYNINSNHSLRPLSSTKTWSTFPIYNLSYMDILQSELRNIVEWSTDSVYFSGQIVRSGNILYHVINTFLTTDMTTDINNGNIVQITGLSSSGSGNIDVFADIGSFPSDGSWTNNNPAIRTWSPSTRILDSLDELNTLVGNVIPAGPPNLDTLNLNFSSAFDANETGTTTTRLVTYDTTPTASTSDFFADANNGTLEGRIQNNIANIVLTSGDDSGSVINGNVNLSVNETDYNNIDNSVNPGLYTAISAAVNSVNPLTTGVDAKTYTITHSITGFVTEDIYIDQFQTPNAVINPPLSVNKKIFNVTSSTSNRISLDQIIDNQITENSEIVITGAGNGTYIVDSVINSTTIQISGTFTTLPDNTSQVTGLRYISGVPTLSVGDTFDIDLSINNAISYFYNRVRIGNLSSTVANNFNIFTPNSSYTQFSNLNSIETMEYIDNVYSETTNVTLTAYNSRGTSGSDSDTDNSSLNARIDTISDETIRVTSGSGQFPSTNYGLSYPSYEDLSLNQELQLLNNIFVYPNVDYSSNLPLNGPDYSSFTGTRYVTFELQTITNVKAITFIINDSINITANGVSPLVTQNFECYLKVEGVTGWLDVNSEYNAGQPLNNGDASYDVSGSTPTRRRCTFGSTISGLTGLVYIRLGISDTSNISFSGVSIVQLD